MNTEGLLDSLDKDAALNFFEGIPTGGDTLAQPVQHEPSIDPRQNPITEAMDTPDFQIEDLIKEITPITNTEVRVDLLGDEDPIEADEPTEVKQDVSNLSALSALFEDNTLSPFEDETPLNSIDDVRELIKANIEDARLQERKTAAEQYHKSLPKEVQMMNEYILGGGTDIKGMFKSLSEVEQVRSLDDSTESGQEEIVSEMLRLQGFSAEEIKDEIDTYKDLETLATKASKFKPKLEQMKQVEVAKKEQEQKQREQQAQEFREYFNDNVTKALSDEDIYGYKLDKTLQSQLYAGMVQSSYPSVDGGTTNLLGRLLEKYQIEAPDMKRVLGATLFMLDPDKFIQQMSTKIEQRVETDAIRKLKGIETKAPTIAPEPEKKAVIKRSTGFLSKL